MTRKSGCGVRVLILTADYPPHAWSGIAAAASNQALALSDAGAEVSVATRVWPSPSISSGSRVCVRGLDEPGFPFRGRTFEWIHLHSLGLTELAFELRRRRGARIAYTAHSLIFRELADGPARRYWSELQLVVMQRSDAVILLSESEREALTSVAPNIARRAHVIANAILPPPAAMVPYRSGGPVVFAGRFTMQKGVGTLRQFIPDLYSSWRGRTVLAGGHGDVEGERTIRELCGLLGGAVSTPGWLSRADLDRLLARASLVLVPSLYEPFGMTALEALRLGTPVLAARVGGLTEIVADESGGRLVDGHEPEAWRSQALEILREDTSARIVARRGPEYVKRLFHPAVIAGRLIGEVYAN